MAPSDTKQQIAKTRKTADLLCTAHAGLRDRYRRFATTLDVAILILSVFLVAQTFADEQLKSSLNFFNVKLGVWIGILSAIIFALSIVQLRVNWKGKAEAHDKSFSLYAGVKRELGYLSACTTVNDDEFRRVMSRYDLAAEVGTGIPEAEFLKQKQSHKIKIAISTYLDRHPGASIRLTRLKLFLKDTFGWNVIDLDH